MKRLASAALIVSVLISASAAAEDCSQITSGLTVGAPTWSPDGTRLAFHATGGIYVVPAAGGAPALVIPGGTWPTWSLDGTHLAFVGPAAEPGGLSDIWVRAVGGGPPQAITAWSGRDTYPDWSHDGDKIVYVSFRNDHIALYVYSFSTGAHTRLTTIEAGVELRYPDWSPSDEQVIFERVLFLEGPEIFVVDYPSGAQRMLFGPYSGFRYPRWHPSGASLIMIGRHEIGDNPCVVRYSLPSGPRQDLLCRLTGLAFPEWAPEGTRFSATEGGNLVVCDAPVAVNAMTWGQIKQRFTATE